MNYFFNIKFLLALGLLAGLLFVSSCYDDDFQEPPISDFPDLEANTTIREVKNLFSGGNGVEIKDSLIIKGVLGSSDEAGNIFKELHIQDSTGGVLIRIDVTELHSFFDVGQEIYVLLQGLYVNEFRGTIQITGDESGNRIPNPLAFRVVRPGLMVGITPEVKTIDQLTDDDISTLIQLDNMQFSCGQVGGTYADPNGATTQSIEIKNCISDDNITLRLSDFSDFAGASVPSGQGSIVGIFTKFDDTNQFTIRSTDDVMFDQARCGANCGEALPISEVRNTFQGTETTAPDGVIHAVVTSDDANGNFNPRNMYVQDATAGILIRFNSDHDFQLNDSIHVDVSGLELSEFRGLLQVNGVPLDRATVKGTGSIEPQEVTIQNILTNFSDYESELVKINMATLSGGNVLGDGITVSDPSGGSIFMFTSFSSSFSNTPVPSGEIMLTAIVSQRDDPQFLLRNASDVGGGGGNPMGGDTFSIQEIRDLYMGSDVPAPQGVIQGIVTSDASAGNIQQLNMFFQDGNVGIALRFTSAPTFQLGQRLEVTITGGTISEFGGLVQVSGLSLSGVSVIGGGNITPQNVDISEILANSEDYESEVVRIDMASFSGGSTFNGTIDINDGTGSIPVFTRPEATFNGDAVPGGTVTVTGVVTRFQGNPQIYIRNLNDIQ